MNYLESDEANNKYVINMKVNRQKIELHPNNDSSTLQVVADSENYLYMQFMFSGG